MDNIQYARVQVVRIDVQTAYLPLQHPLVCAVRGMLLVQSEEVEKEVVIVIVIVIVCDVLVQETKECRKVVKEMWTDCFETLNAVAKDDLCTVTHPICFP
jgi:hypothetical protein